MKVYEVTIKEGASISIPSGTTVDAEDDDEMLELLESIDLDALLEKLKGTSIPADYIESIESFINGSQDDDIDDFYGDDFDDDFDDDYYGGTGTVIPDEDWYY